MKKSIFMRVVAMMLTVTLMLGAISVTASAAGISDSIGSYKNEKGSSPTLDEMKNLMTTKTYEDYILEKLSGENDPARTQIAINTSSADKFGDNFTNEVKVSDSDEVQASIKGSSANWESFTKEDGEKSWFLPSVNPDGSAGVAEWRFDVDKPGFYTIEIDYYDCIVDADTYIDENGNFVEIKTKSSVSAIERKLRIDGVVPFDEVGSITFDKHWRYDYVTTSDPYEVPASARPFTEIGSYAEYVQIAEGEGAGYYKYVTTTKMEGGKMMQTLTTYKINQDINGNSMAPSAVAVSQWSTYTCKDPSGYSEGALKFYFSNGPHSISLEAIREPVIIKEIRLVPAEAPSIESESSGKMSYSNYIAAYDGVPTINAAPTIIEAEFPDLISDSSVTSTNDNTSAITYPISSKAQLYNVIGENSYSAMGQWAAYKFTVSETGLYKLGARFKQDTLQGMFICRAVKLAGGQYGTVPDAPFDEAYRVRFGYDEEWQSEYMGFYSYEYDSEGNKVLDDNGNPVQNKTEIELYFEKGVEYTLYFECSLGDLKDYIRRVETALDVINECYLRILKRTGAEPDKNQDYSFLDYMPEVLVKLLEQSKELTNVADELEALCGTNGSHIATLDTIARILTLMGSDGGEKIAENMANLKSYLGTLGTWINSSKSSSLMLDSIYVVPADSDENAIPNAKANFFESIWFEISSFIYSFFTDYDKMGLTEETSEDDAAVSVWLAMGRDQSQIWRSMIDATGGFTDTYGKGVALKLVTAGTLLPSILSGKGPDVYLGLGSGEVINYAIRDAIIGVSGNAANLTDDQNAVFTNYYYMDANGNEIVREKALTAAEMEAQGLISVSNGYDYATREAIFAPAAMKTLRLCDVAYGIPMTMSFAMMFYRMDVLGNLGVEIPKTWDELIGALPALQASNMTIGVSYVSALDFMIYQMGESMWKYENGDEYDSRWAGAEINLDSNIALEAFERVCSFYTEHSLPVSFDTANRFRTGEMPITVGDYISIYNSLVVFASEIGGLWQFGTLPGSGKGETYNNDSLAGVTATVLLNGCQKKGNDTLLAAWQFAQWQTSREIQASYGNSIVALIGPAAKYETANKLAINDLSWTASEKAAISEQMANMDAIVNYPGSYIIARYMKFAFLDAYNDGTPPQEAMKRYVGAINTELTRKRAEFGDFLFNVEDDLEEGQSVPKLNQ